MPVSRPLPKSRLKKMFMQALSEHLRPDGAFQGHTWASLDVLRSTIPMYFEIEPLSKEEVIEGWRGVFELERDGYITSDPSQGSAGTHKVLTKKGESALRDSPDDMRLPSVDIDQLLDNDGLRERVRDDFLDGDYETAVFRAFHHLEESVRLQTNQPNERVGVGLMDDAFKKKRGILKHPGAGTGAEEDGLHFLMRGAIMWFKNPLSHRTVGHTDEMQAAHILAFANLLLDLADESEVRK